VKRRLGPNPRPNPRRKRLTASVLAAVDEILPHGGDRLELLVDSLMSDVSWARMGRTAMRSIVHAVCVALPTRKLERLVATADAERRILAETLDETALQAAREKVDADPELSTFVDHLGHNPRAVRAMTKLITVLTEDERSAQRSTTARRRQ
jgi:hypothetical protein